METNELTGLVARAAELRQKLEGRLPPRVQFDYKDFLLGVVGMSHTAVGMYMLMLMHQLDKGSLPASKQELWPIARCHGELEEMLLHLDAALTKFTEHEGRLYNKRALQEWIAAAEAMLGFRERGRAGGKRKAEQLKQEPF